MAGTKLADAYVQIIPSAEGIQGSISKVLGSEADSAGTSAGNAITGKIKGAIAAAGIGIALTAAVSKGVSAIKDQITATAEYGDTIDKMSQKLGMSTTAYQEWDAILQHSGSSAQALTAPMRTLNQAAQSGKDAFQALGISQEQVASMNSEELFAATITALQGVTNESERTALATELLGRGAQELGPLLNTSAEDTEAMRQRLHELGGVMSEEAIASAAAYQDTLQDMQTAMSAVSNTMGAELLPSVTEIMSGITEIIVGNNEEGAAKMAEGMSNLASTILNAVPTLVSTAAQVGSEILKTFIDKLPEMVDAGFKLIESLGAGLIDDIPNLVPKVVEVATTIVTKIIEHAPQVLKGGVELIIALAKGLIEAIPEVVKAIPEIITAIKDAFAEFDWAGVGKAVIDGIKNGIKNGASTIAEAAKSAAKSAFEGAKKFLGINSPSRLFRDQIGLQIDRGLAEGIAGNAGIVQDSMDALTFDAVNGIEKALGRTAKVSATLSTQMQASTASIDSSDDIIGTIIQIGSAIVQAIDQKETPSFYLGDREVFKSAQRGSRLVIAEGL